jgi:DNA-binding transcriptional MerR regulator
MQQFTIGEIARRTGLAVSAIRYYEDRGLLPKVDRSANNRRSYGADVIEAIHFIASCRKNEMDIETIRALQVQMREPAPNCGSAGELLGQAVKELSIKIAALQAARRHLSKVASACNAESCGVVANSCTISDSMKATALA